DHCLKASHTDPGDVQYQMVTVSAKHFTSGIWNRQPRPDPPQHLSTEEPFLVVIPVALKDFFGVVFFFLLKKGTHLRVTGFDLILRCPAMVGQVVVAVKGDAEINQGAKRAFRGVDTFSVVDDVQVEDYTGKAFAGPAQKALIIFFDQTYSP